MQLRMFFIERWEKTWRRLLQPIDFIPAFLSLFNRFKGLVMRGIYKSLLTVILAVCFCSVSQNLYGQVTGSLNPVFKVGSVIVSEDANNEILYTQSAELILTAVMAGTASKNDAGNDETRLKFHWEKVGMTTNTSTQQKTINVMTPLTYGISNTCDGNSGITWICTGTLQIRTSTSPDVWENMTPVTGGIVTKTVTF